MNIQQECSVYLMTRHESRLSFTQRAYVSGKRIAGHSKKFGSKSTTASKKHNKMWQKYIRGIQRNPLLTFKRNKHTEEFVAGVRSAL